MFGCWDGNVYSPLCLSPYGKAIFGTAYTIIYLALLTACLTHYRKYKDRIEKYEHILAKPATHSKALLHLKLALTPDPYKPLSFSIAITILWGYLIYELLF